jgi:zinc transport system ATP-binding protein
VRGLKVVLDSSSPVLRGIDLAVHRGEVVALMGANGSGKSTLVRTILHILPATAGAVPCPPASRVGYVPQRVSAAGGIPSTAAEVVASGLLGPGRLRLPRTWRTQVSEALKLVGLADRAHEAINHLSGGQQQRVLIARALIKKPDLLVLDEPVAGVDQPSQEHFAEILGQLIAGGLTVLVVLHELGVLAPLITRAVVLRHGRVVHDGAPPSARIGHQDADHDHVHPHAETPSHTESGFAGFDDSASALTEHPGRRP